MANRMSSDSFSEEPTPFEANEELLKGWPYALHALEDTLDRDLIEGRARQTLFRALNNRELVAFIGTGVSAAYGRMDWSQLRDKQIDEIDRVAGRFIELGSCAQKFLETLRRALGTARTRKEFKAGTIDAADAHLGVKQESLAYQVMEIRRLYATFSAHKRNRGSVFGGEIYPIQFQVAKRLQDALQKAERLFVRRPKAREDGRGDELKFSRLDEHRRAARFGYLLEDSNEPFFRRMLDFALDGVSGKPAHKAFEDAFEVYFDAITRPGANLRFKDYSKLLVYDECPHAQHILTEALTHGLDRGRKDWAAIKDLLLDPPEPEDTSPEADPGGDAPKRRKPRTRGRTWKKVQKTFPPADPERLRRSIPGMHEAPDGYKVLGFYKKTAVRVLLRNLAGLDQGDDKPDFATATGMLGGFDVPAWRSILELIWQNQEEAFSADSVEPPIWTPTRRFIIGMLLSKLEDPTALHWLLPGQKMNLGQEGIEKDYKEIRAEDFRARESVIRRHFDPLHQLNVELGISRFLTTNYDLEVERLFIDRGYRFSGTQAAPPGASEPQRVDPIGGRAGDASFDREHLADMLSFSLDLSGDEASVFHLHGPATQHGEMVLTERDYMDLYLRTDEYRETVDEAIDLAISSNPIMFVGLGMSEDDVLRPLRQFVSNQERRWDRTTIALLGSTKGPDVERTQSSVLYTRYGVQALFYGKAHVDLAGRDKPVEVDWLRLFMASIGALSGANKRILDAARKVAKAVDQRPGDKREKALRDASKDWDLLRKLLTGKGNEGEFKSQLNSAGDDLSAALNDLPSEFEDARGQAPAEWMDWLWREDSKPFLVQDRHHYEHEDETSRVRVDVDVEFELRLLQMLRDAALPVPSLPGDSLSDVLSNELKKSRRRPVLLGAIKTVIRNALAIDVALNGIRSAVHTAFLTAELRKIQGDWQAWWSKWQRPPLERHPEATSVSKTQDDYLPAIQRRHEILGQFSNLPELGGSKEEREAYDGQLVEFYRRENDGVRNDDPALTRIRAFDTFLRSANHDGTPVAWKGRRRIYVVAAHRGLGKGVFLSALSHERGIRAFIRGSWKDDRSDPFADGALPFAKDPPPYAKVIVFNYSFSTEIASTWDLLCKELEHSLEQFVEKDAADSEACKRLIGEAAKMPRTNRLAALLAALGNPSLNPLGRRFLISMNAVDLLLKTDGTAKNAEIDDIFELLLGDRAADLPFDIVQICDENRLPAYMARSSGHMFSVIARPDVRDYGRSVLARRLAATDYAGSYDPRARVEDRPARLQYLHFCRVMQPEAFIFDNFELLAALLHYGFLKRAKRTLDPKPSLEALRTEFHNIIDEWNRHGPDADPIADPTDRRWNESSERRRLLTLFQAFTLEHSAPLPEPGGKTEEEKFWTILKLRLAPENGAELSPEEAALRDRQSFDEWRAIRNTLRYSRFSLTLILAAAEYLALSEPDIDKALEAVERFVRSVVDNVRAVSADRAEEVVLGDVLDAYERFHRAGDPERDFMLHLSILRHLSVFGQPISADVLVRVPEIESHFTAHADERISDTSTENGTRRTDEMRRALDHLERAGLVFRLAVQPQILKSISDPKEVVKAEDFQRFSVHRLVHRHVARKMGGPLTEFASTNSFAPTLFASMPSDLPRPDRDSYGFLRRLVSALSEYPDRHAIGESTEPWHFGTARYETRVQSVRAALGILRSVFSIAVVSRFSMYGQDDGGLRQAGCFEEHRVQLRWLIRKAGDLAQAEYRKLKKSEEPGDQKRAKDGDFLKPFYIDEIVWLYNECGLTCLVQGNLRDAVANFRNALRINENVESAQHAGPNYRRIALNLAVVQIERGRLGSAEHWLRKAREGEKTGSDVDMVATGYFGLVDHLRGNFEAAEAQYVKAIKLATERRDRRTLSIFSRHRGDLQRTLKNYELSATLIGSAIAQAESGGHEDLLNRAYLSQINLDMLLNPDRIDHANVELLDEITAYAHRMDMPSLSCESMRMRAEVMLHRGETTLAGKLLRSAISQAKRHGMHLRVCSCLTRYGEVMIARKLTGVGSAILETALERAKSMRVQVEIDRVEKAMRKLT